SAAGLAFATQSIQDRRRDNFRRLDAFRLLARKSELAHAGAGRAGVDNLDPKLAGMGGFVCISAEQRVERRLGGAVAAPEGARRLAHRGGDTDNFRLFRTAQKRVECRDHCLAREDVELEYPVELLGIEMLDRR